MQFIPSGYYQQPSYYQVPVSDLWLAAADYERRAVEEYRRQQLAEALQQRQEQQRRAAALQRQRMIERQLKQRYLQEVARRRAFEVEARRQETARRIQEQKLREREYFLHQQRKEQENQRARNMYYRHPAFDFLDAVLNADDESETEYGSDNDYFQQSSPSQERDIEMSDSSSDVSAEDPDISVPEDDDSDIYTPAPKKCEFDVRHAPFSDVKNQDSGSGSIDLSDLVNDILGQFFGPQASQSNQPSTSNVPASAVAESKNQHKVEPETPEPEPEVSEEETRQKLVSIQNKVEKAAATFERLQNSESDNQGTSTTLSSKVKVLQKAQIQLEQLYTQLDTTHVPESLKSLKHDLTSRAVSVADKIDALVNVLEARKAELIESEKEDESSDSSPVSSPVSLPQSENSASINTEDVKGPTVNIEAPKQKKLRHVVVETVDDDDFWSN